MGDPVRVYSPDGRLGTVDSDRLPQARERGYVEATPEEIARRERVALGSDTAHQVVGTAAGTLRGVTGGLSESLLENPLGIREDVNAALEANPNLALGSEVVGTGLGLLTGGTEARAAREGVAAAEGGGLMARLGELAHAAGAPARGVVSLGEHAGQLAGRLATGEGATVGRRLLGQAARYGTEGAVQGAGFEALHILNETALGEAPDDVADRLIAATGLGGVLGGGLGGGIGALAEGGRASGALARSTIAALRRAHPEMSEGVASLVEASVRRGIPLAEVLTGDTEGVLARVLGPGGRRARDVIRRGEQVFQEGTPRAQSALDRLMREFQPVREEITGGLKTESVAARMRSTSEGAGIGEHLAQAEGAFSRAQQLADAMAGAAPGSEYGAGAAAASRRIREALDVSRRRVAAAMERGGVEGSAEIFSALDNLKRQIGHAEGYTRERFGEEAVRGLYESIRTDLVNPAVWGEGASELQRSSNAAWQRYLGRARQFERSFLREGTNIGFDTLLEADSARIDSFLRQMGNAANSSSERTFREALEGLSELGGSAAEHFEAMTPQGREALARFRQAAEEAQATVSDVAEQARTLNQFNRLAARESGGIGAIGAGAIGSAAGGPLLGAAAAAASAMSRPTAAVRMLAQIEHLSNGMGERIASSVRGFLGRGERSAGRAATRVVDFAERAPHRALTGAAAYEARIAELDAHRDPRRLSADIAAGTADLGHAAPNVQRVVQARSARAVAYLQSVRPRSRVMPGQLRVDPRQALPSRPEMDRFLRIARAVDNPASVLDDIRSRRITPEAIAAIREVYPSLYRQIVRAVASELSNADREPSYQDRLQLGTLLGVPTDPSLDPSTLATLQQAHTALASAGQAAQPRAAGGRAPDLAGMATSGADRVEARRAIG